MLKNKFNKVLIMFAVFVLFSTINTATACEIHFDILKNKKEVYVSGDIFIAKVEVLLTHRVCEIGIKKTKFNGNGLKIIGATKWKQISPMEYHRKLKVKVSGTDTGKVILTAKRDCDKEGGYGVLKLKVAPIKKKEIK